METTISEYTGLDTEKLFRTHLRPETQRRNFEHNPEITVITPSIRPEGIIPVKACLEEQTFKDFEHIIKLSEPKEKCDLCKKLNEALKEARGKWIVMLQDWITILPDGLERFLKVADENKFITGSMGITSDWKIIKWDWRAYRQGFQEIEYQEWEEDWAIAPKKAFYELGGYDEEYDNYWANENVNLAFRAKKLGYSFWVLPSNKAVQFAHDKFSSHPFRSRWNPDFHNYKIKKIKIGEEPIKLNYLK